MAKFEDIDFKNKKVAFFGLGDQYGYSFYFCDALGVFHDIALKNGATICGKWPTDGYEYDACKAERDGVLVGLCLDIDNQDDLTDARIDQWIPQVLSEFGLMWWWDDKMMINLRVLCASAVIKLNNIYEVFFSFLVYVGFMLM